MKVRSVFSQNLAFALLALVPGQVRFEGRSVSVEERESLRRERESKAAQSLGMRLEGGRWIPATDRSGEISSGGSTASSGTSKPTAGPPPSLEEIARQSNLPFEVYDTLHFRIAGNVDRIRLRDFGQAAEKFWVAFQKLMFGESSGMGSLDASFQSEDGGRFLAVWARDRESERRVLRVLEGRREDVVVLLEQGMSRPELLGQGSHRLAHVFLRRFRFDGKDLPDWLDEGFACLLDMRGGASQPAFCRKEMGASAIAGGQAWTKTLQSFAAQRKLRPLKVLMGLSREEMGLEDVLQAMSFLEFCAKRASLPRLLEAVRANAPRPGTGFSQGVDAIKPHEAALQQVLGTSNWDSLESSWRAFLEAQR